MKGTPIAFFEELAAKLKARPGAKALLQYCKAMGIKSAIVSGGFAVIANALAKELQIDFVFAHQLPISNHCLNGELPLS